MAEESKGINVLFGQLFQSTETGMNEIRNSSPNMQGQKESSIQKMRQKENEIRTQEAEA